MPAADARVFLIYIRQFLKNTHPLLLAAAVAFAALLIWLNYTFGIEAKIIQRSSSRTMRFAAFYFVYFTAFAIPYLMLVLQKGAQAFHRNLLLMVILAPAIFAFKVSFGGFYDLIRQSQPGPWGRYWALIARLPVKCLFVTAMLAAVWKAGRYDAHFLGAFTGHINQKPYFLLLLLMVPLIAWASFQPAFLHTYPKLRQVAFIEPHTPHAWLYKLLYELSYGMDFLTIELFFRGFLVLGFVRFAGQDAIIPMAVFYCSIHFGKPVAECISSLFGGLLLGIVVYNTRSIAGGLTVHLGIAWLMEAGGYLGGLSEPRFPAFV